MTESCPLGVRLQQSGAVRRELCEAVLAEADRAQKMVRHEAQGEHPRRLGAARERIAGWRRHSSSSWKWL